MTVSKPLASAITVGALALGVAGGSAITMRRDVAGAPQASPTASPAPSASPSATPAVPSPVAITEGKTEVHAYGQSGLLAVTGEVKNWDKVAHGAALSAVLYGPDGKVVGSGSGVVGSVDAGKTSPFTIISQDLVDGTGVVAKVTVSATL